MRALTAIVALLFFSTAAAAQTGLSLHDEVAAMDKKLFDAFNAGEIDVVAGIFDKTLEFYHDRGGLAGYEQSVAQLKELFSKPNRPRRELVPGTSEVHPISNYGAVQIGTHRFCHDENGKADCGVFKFVHIWQKKNASWTLTRVVSYDH